MRPGDPGAGGSLYGPLPGVAAVVGLPACLFAVTGLLVVWAVRALRGPRRASGPSEG